VAEIVGVLLVSWYDEHTFVRPSANSPRWSVDAAFKVALDGGRPSQSDNRACSWHQPDRTKQPIRDWHAKQRGSDCDLLQKCCEDLEGGKLVTFGVDARGWIAFFIWVG
jgi:hypothetical protein